VRNTTREMNRDSGADESRARPHWNLPFKKAGMRGGVIGVVALIAVLAAVATMTVRLLDNGNGHGAGDAAALITPSATVQASTAGLGTASKAMPQLAATPRVAVMPTQGKGSATRPAPSGSPSVAPSTSASARASSSPTAAPPTTAPGSATCQHPQYTTSDPTAMWNLAPYFVANDMWGISGYNVSQTLYACSYSDWYVVATMNNDSGNGAVKTYPNSHRDFDSEPKISSFSSITSTFAETSPGTGIYEDAYDIWLNGIASSGSTEVMIWTQNNGQTPAGSAQGTVTLDGRSYTVWKTTGNYIAFVANSNFTSGTMNLLDFFNWLMSKGWLPTSSTLGQVDYGAELVSTNGVPATFTFSNFSVNAS
jgi:hypothetical protein